MYDMYPWDSASQGEYPPQPLRSWRNPARKPAKAATAARSAEAPRAPRDISPAQAVQVALDRRDNGGNAQAVTQAATHSAAAPAVSQARQ